MHALFDDGEKVVADMLISADGAGSTVRELMQMPSEFRYAGQGACQSVEDAAILAMAAKNSRSVGELISRYEKARIPRTTHIINYSRKIGTFSSWSNPVSVRLRELMFNMLPKDKLTASFEEITDIDFEIP